MSKSWPVCVRPVHTNALIHIVCLRQEGDFLVRTHHVEYCDGGILDPDDVLSDLVEDKDKVRALLLECDPGRALSCCWLETLTAVCISLTYYVNMSK